MITNLDDLKTYLGITGTASDTILTMQTNIVESEISSIIDRQLGIATYTDESLVYLGSNVDGQPTIPLDMRGQTPAVFLANYPVVQMISLESNESEVSTNAYSLGEVNGVIRLGGYWPDLRANYVAGYTSDTLPYDLQSLIYEGVRALYAGTSATTKRGSGGEVASKRIGDFAVTYRDGMSYNSLTSNVLPGLAKRYLIENQHILAKYKKVNV